MKTEIYLSKEFLKHINDTVQPLPGNEVVIMVKDDSFKVFNRNEKDEYILAIYKPKIQVDYAPDTIPPATGSNGHNTNGHTTNY